MKASPRNPIEISSLTQIVENSYEALPRINKRGSEQDREKNASSTSSSIVFKHTEKRLPFWIALDEVQDPQVFLKIDDKRMITRSY